MFAIINNEKFECIEALLWWQKRGLMYTSTGYGSKIPTSYMVKFLDKWRRVYCVTFSNCGTLYVIVKDQKFIVQDIER